MAIKKFSSSITSELFAFLHAFYLVYSLKIVKVVIATDSLSSLQSITNCNCKKHSFSNKFILLCSTLAASGYEIRFLWVPGHENIPGNKMAYKLAKLSTAEASLSPPQGVHYKHVTTRLNFSQMFSALYQHCFQEWYIQYQTATQGNAYKAVFPALLRSSLPIRSLSLIIFCLCTGHCKLNHHLSRIGLYPDELCGQCEIPETVEHLIEVCPKYLMARNCLKLPLNHLGISFHTPEILRSTAAAKLVETFV